MNWIQQDRSVASLVAGLALATLCTLWFLFHEKGQAAGTRRALENTVSELNRLRAGAPLPNDKNLRITRVQTEGYRSSLLALERELKDRMFPRLPLQPNEFQAQMRLAVTAVQQRAKANKVQLPASFNLGFDQYATSLPNGEAAPELGRQLRAVEWLTNTIIDAHADAIVTLTRAPLPEEKPILTLPGTPKPLPASTVGKRAAAKIVDASSVNLKFAGSPATVGRILNQFGSSRDQMYVLRTLVVKNQVDQAPRRDRPEGLTSASAQTEPVAKGRQAPVAFIVGNEHLEVATKIEIVSFAIPEGAVR